jgi:hypothetical protein
VIPPRGDPVGTIPVDRYVDEVVALVVGYLLSPPRC